MPPNPYTPVTHPASGRRRWRLGSFLILNLILIAIPTLLLIVLYLRLRFSGVQLSGSSGSIGRASLLLVAAYFVVPNCLMFLMGHSKSVRDETGVDMRNDDLV